MLGMGRLVFLFTFACIAVGTLCLPGVVVNVHMLLHEFGVTLTGGVPKVQVARNDVLLDAKTLSSFFSSFLILNWGFRWLLVEPFAYRLLQKQENKVIKFSQSVMEVLIYGIFSAMGIRIVSLQDWVWPSSQWWMGHKDGTRFLMRADLRCFYLMYMARYLQATVSILMEPKRKDFMGMMLHHITTVIVIYASYMYGWSRIGVVVMVLMDPADVPLHMAKLCKYTSEATGRQMWQFLADRLFELFAVAFFFSRLVGYGYVCWSSFVEANRYVERGLPEWACRCLLWILFLLQCYWFLLILKVAASMMRGESSDDPRSDDESEVQDGKKCK